MSVKALKNLRSKDTEGGICSVDIKDPRSSKNACTNSLHQLAPGPPTHFRFPMPGFLGPLVVSLL